MNVCRLCNKEFGNAGGLQFHINSRKCVKDRLKRINKIKWMRRIGRASTEELETLRKKTYIRNDEKKSSIWWH